MNNLYLAFIDEFETTPDGLFVYRFYFTEEPDVVWGEKWNVVPCSVIPNIDVDIQTVSMVAKVTTNEKYNLAKNSSCFSMQDCIDGIISMLFTNPTDQNDLILNFGESLETVKEKLNEVGLTMTEEKEIRKEQEDAIVNATIEALETNNNNDDGDNSDPFDDIF